MTHAIGGATTERHLPATFRNLAKGCPGARTGVASDHFFERETLLVLHGDQTRTGAIDLESKLTEAARSGSRQFLKSRVITANRYEPEINRTYAELARHCDAVVIPARVARPKGKPHVEAVSRSRNDGSSRSPHLFHARRSDSDASCVRCASRRGLSNARMARATSGKTEDLTLIGWPRQSSLAERGRCTCRGASPPP